MGKKVLQVIPSIHPSHGGPSAAIRAIESCLIGSDWDSLTFTTNDGGKDEPYDVPLGFAVKHEGATRIFCKRSFQFYKVSISGALWLWKRVRDFDVVHIHALFSFLSVWAAFCCWRQRVPFVIRPLGTLSKYGVRTRRPWLKVASLCLLDGPLLRRAKVIHFTSRLELGESSDYVGSTRHTIMPIGVPGIEVRNRVRVDDDCFLKRLLFVGRLDKVKNIEGLLGALKILRSEGKPVGLDVCGGGEEVYFNQLRELSVNLGLSESVRWHGMVGLQEKTKFFTNASCFIQPSFSENLGISLIEAMSAGIPCVVSEGVGLADMVKTSSAGLVVGSTPRDIASALTKLKDDPILQDEISCNARSLFMREFSLETMGKNLVAMYNEASLL